MGNSTSNTRRNVIRGIVALIIILIILLCLRLCKHDKEEVPTPQPTPSASTPQDTIKQDTTTISPVSTKAWQKVSKPKKKRKVIAVSVLQPAKEVAVPEKKETPQEQPKQQAIIEPEPDDIVTDTAETIREPKPKRVFSHKHYYQTRIGIRAGMGYSVIGNLGALVEDGAIRPRYTMEEKGALVPSIGVFAL